MKTKKRRVILFVSLLLLLILNLSCQEKASNSKKKNDLKTKAESKVLKKEIASDLEFLVASSDTQILKKNIESLLETYSILPKTENGISRFTFSSSNRFLHFVTANENFYSFDLASKKLKKINLGSRQKIYTLGFDDSGEKLLFVEIPPGEEGSERFIGTYHAYYMKKNKSEPLFRDKIKFFGAWFSEKLYLNDIKGQGSEKSDVYLIDLKNKNISLFIKNAQLIGKSPDNKKFLLFRLASGWYEKNGDSTNGELWVINRDGSGLEKIAFTGMPPNACFSPDGSKIAFLKVRNPKRTVQLLIYDCQNKSQHLIKRLEKYNLEKLQWIDADRLIFSTNPYAGKSFVGVYSLKKDAWVKIFDDASANQILKVFIK